MLSLGRLPPRWSLRCRGTYVSCCSSFNLVCTYFSLSPSTLLVFVLSLSLTLYNVRDGAAVPAALAKSRVRFGRPRATACQERGCKEFEIFFFRPIVAPSPFSTVKERKRTSQGRDGRTARRHHTGILRRGVWCTSRRPAFRVQRERERDCFCFCLHATSRSPHFVKKERKQTTQTRDRGCGSPPCTAVAGEGVGQVPRGDSGRLEPRMELATE